ncbi:MAG: hypothetical protein J2P31_10685 [Blastocatellia bacterium]|nr:hypothetical protein [Blastocatellia bacterium]
MDNFTKKDFTEDYLALKAENDRLREDGKRWLMNTLDLLCAEINNRSTGKEGAAVLEVGRQEWQFKVGNSLMIGERFGARHLTRTLVVEAGWPRTGDHGFVPDGGLARARVGLSQNIMLEALTIADLILKREGKNAPFWYIISNSQIGERVSEIKLRSYLSLLLVE